MTNESIYTWFKDFIQKSGPVTRYMIFQVAELNGYTPKQVCKAIKFYGDEIVTTETGALKWWC